MASEHAHKIDGAVRKLRAVMEAFDMKGTNRATMLNAINTINALRTRPAPAATVTGLVTVAQAYVNEDGECEEIAWIEGLFPHPECIQLVTRSQAEELLAAERAKTERLADDYQAIREQLHRGWRECKDLKADNAAKDARIKELENVQSRDGEMWVRQSVVKALEAKLEAAEKALEPFANAADGRKSKSVTGSVCFSQHYLLAARAVLGGKPS